MDHGSGPGAWGPTKDFACIRGPRSPQSGGEGRNGGREHGATAIHDSAANGWAAPPAKHGGAKNKSHGAEQPATLEQRGTTARSDTLTSPAPLERCSIGVPSGAGDMAMAVTNLCNGLMDTSKTAQYKAKLAPI